MSFRIEDKNSQLEPMYQNCVLHVTPTFTEKYVRIYLSVHKLPVECEVFGGFFCLFFVFFCLFVFVFCLFRATPVAY